MQNEKGDRSRVWVVIYDGSSFIIVGCISMFAGSIVERFKYMSLKTSRLEENSENFISRDRTVLILEARGDKEDDSPFSVLAMWNGFNQKEKGEINSSLADFATLVKGYALSKEPTKYEAAVISYAVANYGDVLVELKALIATSCKETYNGLLKFLTEQYIRMTRNKVLIEILGNAANNKADKETQFPFRIISLSEGLNKKDVMNNLKCLSRRLVVGSEEILALKFLDYDGRENEDGEHVKSVENRHGVIFYTNERGECVMKSS